MKQKNKNDNDKKKNPAQVVSMKSRKTDPFGSYTGNPKNPNETPTQDADDL